MTYQVTITGGTSVSVTMSSVTFPVSVTQMAESDIAAKVLQAKAARDLALDYERGAEDARDASQVARNTALGYKGDVAGLVTQAEQAAADALANTYGQDLSGHNHTYPLPNVLKVIAPRPYFDYDHAAWIEKFPNLSYKTEDRTTGVYKNARATLAAAIAAGGVVGDYYYNSASDGFFEITGIGPNTEVETFRAGSANFPYEPEITAEADRVVIWDKSDGSMWMVFVGEIPGLVNGPHIYAWAARILAGLNMLNGKLRVGTNNTAGAGLGFIEIDFLADTATLSSSSGRFVHGQNIANRNLSTTGMGYVTSDPTGAIIDSSINAIAVTTMQDAPINAITGLPVDTVAAGTNGNGTYLVSIKQNDGSIYDIGADGGNTAVAIDFRDDGALVLVRSDGTVYVWQNPGDIAADGAAPNETYTTTSSPSLLGTPTTVYNNAFGSPDGLTVLLDSSIALRAGSDFAYIEGADTEGAYLCGSDDTDLANTPIADEDFLGYADTAAFEADFTVSAEATALITAGGVQLTNSGGSNKTATKTFTTVVGDRYMLRSAVTNGTGAGRVYATGLSGFTTNSTASFVATTTSTVISLLVLGADGTDAEFNSFELLLADQDYSHNGNHLPITSAATRTKVATGADLVWTEFTSDETVTLGADISATGMVEWWEEVSGVETYYAKDLSGGTSYVNGAAGTPPTDSITFSGADMTFKAGKKLALIRPSSTVKSAEQVALAYNIERHWFDPDAVVTLDNAIIRKVHHDALTEKYHVLTDGGYNVFDADTWLQTDYVAGDYNDVYAVGGEVMLATATGVLSTSQARDLRERLAKVDALAARYKEAVRAAANLDFATSSQGANADTAHGWGDHSIAGYATQTYVTNQIDAVLDTAPGTLDTLNELAAALGDDANFAGTMTTALAGKATAAQGSKADTAHGWGDHGTVGYATTSYVTGLIDGLLDSAPGTLDTLNELAASLGDDANFAATMTTALAGKATTAQGTKADAALPRAGGVMTGALTLKGIIENATSSSGSSYALNAASSTRHTHTCSGATTLTDSLTDGQRLTLRLINADTQGFTPVAGTLWVGGVVPTWTDDDFVTFEKWGSDLIGYAGTGLASV